MASTQLRLPHNAEGDFYVDSTCIDCDTCRWMAPEVFTRREAQSSVAAQPADDASLRRAELALISCPTASIGTVDRHDLGPAQAALPDRIESGSGVYHCGYHSESSFGAASYLVVRESGNVLVDSPRFTRPLVRRLEELGGVATMFLTHRDDVADHERFADHFRCERVMHAADRTRGTEGFERWIEGTDPVSLDGEDGELVVVPTPGHTRGSACLLYRDRFLFTGDHLAWSEPLGHLYGFRSACWYDWSTLMESTSRMRDLRFEWVLPGHGRRARIAEGTVAEELERALEWMRSVA